MRLIYLTGTIQAPYIEAFHYLNHRAENLCFYSPLLQLSKDPHKRFHMIRLSTAVWVQIAEDWEKSYTLSQEMEYAESIGREILYVMSDDVGEFFLSDTHVLPGGDHLSTGV